MAKSKSKSKTETDAAEPESGPPFEESLSELEQIVHDLEDGALGLEESLGRFEQAIGLLKNCYRVLECAEQRIDVLTGFDADGNPVVTPFDATATVDAAKTPAAGRRKKRSASSPTAEAGESEDDGASTLF